MGIPASATLISTLDISVSSVSGLIIQDVMNEMIGFSVSDSLPPATSAARLMTSFAVSGEAAEPITCLLVFARHV